MLNSRQLSLHRKKRTFHKAYKETTIVVVSLFSEKQDTENQDMKIEDMVNEDTVSGQKTLLGR